MKLTLSSDTEFKEIISYVEFISKNNSELNIKLKKDTSSNLKGNQNFNLIFDGIFTNNNYFYLNISDFKTILVNENAKIKVHGKTIFSSKIINHGEIIFDYDRSNEVYSYAALTKTIKNNGILSGRLNFALEDKSIFKYIISENSSLTSEELSQLDSNSRVTFTEDLVPFLIQKSKNFYIHTKKGSLASITNLKEDISESPFSENTPTTYQGNEPANIIFKENTNTEKYTSPDADTTSPVITLIGESNIILEFNTSYTEQGATAIDEFDGNITSSIEITQAVNISLAGDYVVTYKIIDSSGNISIIIRNVKIKEKVSSAKTSKISASSKAKKVSVCRDEKALNYKKVGLHKQALCQYGDSDFEIIEHGDEKKPGLLSGCVGLVGSSLASCKSSNVEEGQKNIEEKKQDKINNLQKKLQEILRELNDKIEEKKRLDLTEEPDQTTDPTSEKIFLLNSTCLNMYSSNKFLKMGQKKNDKKSVQILQMFLNTYGYNTGYADGIFGNKTKEKLKEFQKDNNLVSDGIFGFGTVGFIDSNCESLKNKSFFEEEKKKEAEDFASQNPLQEKILTKKETIISPIIQNLINEKEQKEKETQKDLDKQNEKID
jgi:hypothetical protein